MYKISQPKTKKTKNQPWRNPERIFLTRVLTVKGKGKLFQTWTYTPVTWAVRRTAEQEATFCNVKNFKNEHYKYKKKKKGHEESSINNDKKPKKITQSSKVNIHCMYRRQGRGILLKLLHKLHIILKKICWPLQGSTCWEKKKTKQISVHKKSQDFSFF